MVGHSLKEKLTPFFSPRSNWLSIALQSREEDLSSSSLGNVLSQEFSTVWTSIVAFYDAFACMSIFYTYCNCLEYVFISSHFAHKKTKIQNLLEVSSRLYIWKQLPFPSSDWPCYHPPSVCLLIYLVLGEVWLQSQKPTCSFYFVDGLWRQSQKWRPHFIPSCSLQSPFPLWCCHRWSGRKIRELPCTNRSLSQPLGTKQSLCWICFSWLIYLTRTHFVHHF